ncbi:putative transposase [Morganella morganii]|nr:putative transposase [Morganella morganii]
MPAFEWVHVQLHQQKGMISLSPPTICNSADQPPLVSTFHLHHCRSVYPGSCVAQL